MRILFVVLILTSAVCAATGAGSFRGVVEDSNGGTIAGARISLTGKSGEPANWQTADESGRFEINGVATGDYILHVKAKGFDEALVPVKITEADKPPVRVRLAVAAVSEDVEVSDRPDAAPVAAENRDVLRLSERLIGDLPARDGDLGATPALFTDRTAMGVGGPSIVVDGVESGNLDIPASSVKRLYVNRSPYSAEFAQAGRGRIEIITKSGSRTRIHRSGSVAFRNSLLEARNAFAATRPPMSHLLVEGGVDGPIGKDRGGFVLTGRYTRFDDSVVLNARTPAGPLVDNLRTPERGLRLFARGDYHLTPLHTLTVSDRWKDSNKDNTGVGGFDTPERAVRLTDRENRLTVSETAILSANWSNESRFSVKQSSQSAHAANDLPAVVVLDAFSSGGAQQSSRNRESAVDLQNVATFVSGRHSVRFGAGARLRSLRTVDADNFGGVFLFSSLEAFTANRPFLYRINSGDPSVSFGQNDTYGFVQDDIRLGATASISTGIRYEVQSGIVDYNNFAPRFAIAWSPGGGRTTIRAGSGMFYDREPKTFFEQSALFDGERVRQSIVLDPVYPVNSAPAATFATPSVRRIAADLHTPYIAMASFGVERSISSRALLGAEYSTIRGRHLFRSRNINAPLPGTDVRPDPAFLNIEQFESSGRSTGQSLRITFQAEIGGKFRLFSQYALSCAYDNTPAGFALPANNYDLHSEWGRADFDQRHRFTTVATAHLPVQAKLGATLNITSGAPYNITTGHDDNHDSVANDRPAGISRNAGMGPGSATLDLRLSKKIALVSEGRLRPEILVDAFNVMNAVNYRSYIGNIASPFFGRANSALPGRQIQVSLRIKF